VAESTGRFTSRMSTSIPDARSRSSPHTGRVAAQSSASLICRAFERAAVVESS